MTTIRLAFVLPLSLAAMTSAVHAVDIPLSGKTVIVKRPPSEKEKLVFVAKDVNVVLPAAGSAADPLVASTGDAFVEIVSAGAAPVGAFAAPAGAGWSSNPDVRLRYKNRDAPDGESVVKTLLLKQGKKLKVVAKHAGLGLGGGQGAVGIRITFGRGTPDELRFCTRFGGTTKNDEPGLFKAQDAPVALADCSDASLGTYGELAKAIPLNATACGPTFDGIGSSTAPGSDLHRVTLDGALAVCNDGSPAVFYVRPATAGGGHENDWLFWLEGGGSCGDAVDCADRWCGVGGQSGHGAHKMSSLSTFPAIRGNGIFDQATSGEASNFRDWNQVMSYYCSSDNYVGRNTVDVEPVSPYPGYKVHFKGQDILTAMLDAVATGVTSDDTLAQLPPIAPGARLLFAGTSGGAVGAMLNVDRVAAWAAAVPVGSFHVSIDARIVPVWDDTTFLLPAMKEASLASGQLTAAFRNDVADESCAAHHASDDPRLCNDPTHVLLHHVAQSYLMRQDQEDPVAGPAFYLTFGRFAAAVRSVLATQFLQRPTIVLAEEAALASLPLPVAFSPLCQNHVGLESRSFYDDKVAAPSSTARNYNQILWDYVEGLAPASLIHNVGGAATTACAS